MSLWTRIANAFRGDRLSREIEEEIQSHIAEAIEQGRDPAEARQAFGPALRTREECRDFRVLAWVDSLRADTIFAWRQFAKHKVTSAAAVLSLALAIGACTAAFRLIDAILLRPLPVAAPQQLYSVLRQVTNPADDRQQATSEVWAYPSFQLMRAAVKGQAELLAVSDAKPTDVTYKSDAEMEKASVQYVSGWMFDSFGLRPAAGRLFTGDDDSKPRVHAYAVLSYQYWTRRFGRDPKAVGRTFQMGEDYLQIIGVAPEPFTGTETGTATDVFLPTMMHPGAVHDDWTWHRTLARIRPGVALEPLRAKLNATSRAFEEERAKGFKNMTRETIERFLMQKVILEPAAAGASGLQQDYRMALAAMGVLVALVLLIACANVANLMTAQAAARAREMALRVSIGAGRGRLVQLVLVESAWLAMASAALGAWLAWWSAPFVMGRINPPGNPVRLNLPADGRVLAFGVALTLAVTLLFGLAPALRASRVNPASALRGGASSPHARQRLMHALIAVQVAFCFVVLFVAALFAATFDHLLHRPMGFSADRVLTLDAISQRGQPSVFWEQAADRLRGTPGVETVAVAAWPLLSSNSWNGFVSVNGAPPGPSDAEFMKISPGWLDTMKLPLLSGRDFRPDDTLPGSAIVNETFVRQILNGLQPLGVQIAKGEQSFRVVGVVRDAPYRDVHEDIRPVVFVPFHSAQQTRNATFVVRTASANPLAVASILRHQVTGARISNVRTQMELVQAQTVRERLMSMLALFFAAVALLLAGIGLYGVLDYSVLQRRREIGIRIAIGAQATDIAGRVIADVLRMVLAGALAGLALGMLSVRYIATLLYQVRPGDPAMLAVPSAIILAAALIAALPAVLHAVRIDPVAMLRAD
jgi:predicted permease